MLYVRRDDEIDERKKNAKLCKTWCSFRFAINVLETKSVWNSNCMLTMLQQKLLFVNHFHGEKVSGFLFVPCNFFSFEANTLLMLLYEYPVEYWIQHFCNSQPKKKDVSQQYSLWCTYHRHFFLLFYVSLYPVEIHMTMTICSSKEDGEKNRINVLDKFKSNLIPSDVIALLRTIASPNVSHKFNI